MANPFADTLQSTSLDYINSTNFGDQMQQPHDWFRLPYEEYNEIQKINKDILMIRLLCSFESVRVNKGFYDL